MNSSEKLGNLNVAIVTHVFATGPAQELEGYLKNKVNKLLFIGHPFSYTSDVRSFYKVYSKGKLVKEKKAFRWKLPEIFLYLKDVFYTFSWMLFQRQGFDLYVGADNLNAFVGILLKRVGRVKKVVFYTIDYHPQRFSNRILNRLYHWLDKFCLENCDYVWNLSPLMAEAREKRGLKKDNMAHQLTVPIGVNFERIKRLPIGEINRHAIAYMGHLRKNQGVDLIIEALPDIIREVPDARLMVIGTGLLEAQLKSRVSDLGVDEHVTFTGFVESHQEVEDLLASCAIGIAAYEPNPESFTYYADPSKPKQYMACGLPLIITRVPWIANVIEDKSMGIAINYDKMELANAVIRLMNNNEFYEECRRNAIQFASELSWDKIFGQALSGVSEHRQEPWAMPPKVLGWRKRMLAKSGMELSNTHRVLDVGCGDGGDCMMLAGKAEGVVGVDFQPSENWPNVAADNLDLIVADACYLPFRDNAFDGVFEKDTLHHVENHKAAVAEMRRVSRKGGWVVVIEANRYNPILYVHMTLMRGHQHFTGKYFRNLVSSNFEDVTFVCTESHVYPTRSESALKVIYLLEDILAKVPLVKHYLSYNIAVIDR